MRTVCIIQARMTSSRLPGKVLLPLPYGSKTTALAQVVRRAEAAEGVDQVMVATTTNVEDDPVIAMCEKLDIASYRGSEDHVLERFYLAARSVKAERIVRVTGDCPCLDPGILDRVIMEHEAENADFTSSGIKRTFPVGIDQSVFSFEMLEEAYRNAKADFEIEHVTPYFYRSHPDRFKVHVVQAPPEFHRPGLRLTLDTRSDYLMMCALFDQLYPSNPLFSLKDILDLLDRKAWIEEINQSVVQKKVFGSLEEELEELRQMAEQQDMHRARAFLEDRKPGS